jgi:hypothetical protein
MLEKLCPHLYALTLVCSSNLIVEVAPYSDILCFNGCTYTPLPMILVLYSLCRHKVQLVGGLLIEPLVRGSNSSGARVQWIESC